MPGFVFQFSSYITFTILLSHSIRIQLILRLTYLVFRILFMFGIWMFPFYKTDVLFRSILSFSFVELSGTELNAKNDSSSYFFPHPCRSIRSVCVSCFTMRIYLSQYFFLRFFFVRAFHFSCHQCCDMLTVLSA